MTDETIPTFAALTKMTPDQLKQPASRKLLGQVVDHSAEAIRALSARVETLETKLKELAANEKV